MPSSLKAPPGPLAAKRATATIPIVILNVSDPVASGLVATLARPGGNVTGAADLSIEPSEKLLDLAHAAVRSATLSGIEAATVFVEVDVASGLPSFTTVGSILTPSAAKTTVADRRGSRASARARSGSWLRPARSAFRAMAGAPPEPA
jgi:hypothetical protein